MTRIFHVQVEGLRVANFFADVIFTCSLVSRVAENLYLLDLTDDRSVRSLLFLGKHRVESWFDRVRKTHNLAVVNFRKCDLQLFM